MRDDIRVSRVARPPRSTDLGRESGLIMSVHQSLSPNKVQASPTGRMCRSHIVLGGQTSRQLSGAGNDVRCLADMIVIRLTQVLGVTPDTPE